MGLKTLFNNLRYLSRYNLKEFNNKIIEFDERFEFLKYEIVEESEQTYRPNILNNIETIKYLLNNGNSLSRFGDGEFNLIQGKDCVFQKHNVELQKRLNEILGSDLKNHSVAIPFLMCHLRKGTKEQKRFTRAYYTKNNDWIFHTIIKDKLYLDSSITCTFPNQEEFNLMREIWEKRDIAIICGDRVFKNIKYNVFDNAKSIEYINAPTVNAFDEYDSILDKAKKIDKNKLICIILGPTATVLAYDLAKEGYQALDLGHIVKSYDLFMNSNKTSFSQEVVSKFFDKD